MCFCLILNAITNSIWRNDKFWMSISRGESKDFCWQFVNLCLLCFGFVLRRYESEQILDAINWMSLLKTFNSFDLNDVDTTIDFVINNSKHSTFFVIIMHSVALMRTFYNDFPKRLLWFEHMLNFSVDWVVRNLSLLTNFRAKLSRNWPNWDDVYPPSRLGVSIEAKLYR